MYISDSTLEGIASLATKCLQSDSASDHWQQSEYKWFSAETHRVPDWPTLDNPWTPENDDTLLHPKSEQSGCQDTGSANTGQKRSYARNCPAPLLESGTVGYEDSKHRSKFACAARSWWELQCVRLSYPRHIHKCLPTTDDIHRQKRLLIPGQWLHRDGPLTKR